MYGELVHSVVIHSGDYVSHDRLLSFVNLLENSFTISYVLDSFYGNTGVRTFDIWYVRWDDSLFVDYIPIITIRSYSHVVLITHDINILDPAVSGVHLHNSVDDSFRCDILNENIHNKAIRDGKYLARHMPVLGNVHPIKKTVDIFFRDVISLLARVFILLIDTATQEVPMKNIWKKLSSFWDTLLNCYMLNVAHVTNDVKWRPIVTTFGTLIENMSRTGLYGCHIS